MSKTKKIILSLLVVGLLAVGGIWYFVFYRPTLEKELKEGIPITVVQLINEWNVSEDSTYKKYYDKVLDVTGDVSRLDTSTSPTLDNKIDTFLNVTLKSQDSTKFAYITLNKKEKAIPKLNSTVTIRAKFSAFVLSDAQFTDGIIIKP